MASKSAAQIVITKVLTKAGHPMRSKDIREAGLKLPEGKGLSGVTITTTLAVQAKKGGIVKRNAGGMYVLNTAKQSDAKAAPKRAAKATAKATDKTPTAASGPKAIKDVSEIDAALAATDEVKPDPKPSAKKTPVAA